MAAAAENLSPATKEFDVAIVGAGPAGASAALALRGSGLRVGLVEKGNPPRYKTCGGGVLGRAAAMLPIDLGSVVERECFSAEMVHHGPSLRFLCERERPVVSMVMRDRFDHLLTEEARSTGAELLANTTVLAVHPTSEHIDLSTSKGTIRAQFLIAADGANSTIARKIGAPELRGVVPALECEVAYAPEIMAPHLRAARFDFGLVPAGYAWVFPKRNHLSIGVLTTRRGAANLPDHYRRYLAALGLTMPPIREERHGYIIPCCPREHMFSFPRVLFVGDAAGLADPVTAEGISAGILSGLLAARAIIGGGCVDAKVRRLYGKSLRENLLRDLGVARKLAWILYECPRLRAGLLRRHGQQMSELLTRIVMGETTYRAAIRSPRNFLKLFKSRREP